MKHRKFFDVNIQNYEAIKSYIKNQRYEIITINDSPYLSNKDFEIVKPMINLALDTILPNKSSFEI